jgi:hypothetical protein
MTDVSVTERIYRKGEKSPRLVEKHSYVLMSSDVDDEESDLELLIQREGETQNLIITNKKTTMNGKDINSKTFK